MSPSWARGERALLEIVLYETTDNGEYRTYTYELLGQFSGAGAKMTTEGDMFQIHPLGLCNKHDDEELHKYGWVAVVKLEKPEIEPKPKPCLTVYGKAKRAFQRGATAVVFDVTDNHIAAKQLLTQDVKQPVLKRPIVVMQDKQAAKLMEIIQTRKIARARIVSIAEEKAVNRDYYDMAIFLAFFLLICIICIVIIVKMKWCRRHKQNSLTHVAKQALARMQVKRYKASGQIRRCNSVCSQESDACAICLETYQEGQELRILPCSHEFHRPCIDPWLIASRTCPLCLYNIVDCQYEESSPQCRRRDNGSLAASWPGMLDSPMAGTSGANSRPTQHLDSARLVPSFYCANLRTSLSSESQNPFDQKLPSVETHIRENHLSNSYKNRGTFEQEVLYQDKTSPMVRSPFWSYPQWSVYHQPLSFGHCPSHYQQNFCSYQKSSPYFFTQRSSSEGEDSETYTFSQSVECTCTQATLHPVMQKNYFSDSPPNTSNCSAFGSSDGVLTEEKPGMNEPFAPVSPLLPSVHLQPACAHLRRLRGEPAGRQDISCSSCSSASVENVPHLACASLKKESDKNLGTISLNDINNDGRSTYISHGEESKTRSIMNVSLPSSSTDVATTVPIKNNFPGSKPLQMPLSPPRSNSHVVLHGTPALLWWTPYTMQGCLWPQNSRARQGGPWKINLQENTSSCSCSGTGTEGSDSESAKGLSFAREHPFVKNNLENNHRTIAVSQENAHSLRIEMVSNPSVSNNCSQLPQSSFSQKENVSYQQFPLYNTSFKKVNDFLQGFHKKSTREKQENV